MISPHQKIIHSVMDNIRTEIIWFWNNFLFLIKGFFSSTLQYWRLWLALYTIFIISLYLRLSYSYKTFQKVNTLFRVSMDTLYYEVSILLYKHQNDIHEFKENIPLLLQHKTEFIHKKDNAHYYEDFNQLLQEVEYIYQLTESGKIITNKDEIVNQYNIVITLTNTIKNIKNTLTIFTLGIYKLLQ